MHGAPVCHFEQLCTLLRGQITMQLDVALDAIEHATLRITFRAVNGMDLRVPQPYGHCLQWPLLPACIE